MLPLWFRPWMAWAALVLGLFLYGRHEHTARLEALKAVGVAQAQLADLRAAVAQQNAGVDAMQKQGEAQAIQVAAAAQQAKQVRTAAEKQVQQILITPVPPDAELALRWGEGQARELGARWNEVTR